MEIKGFVEISLVDWDGKVSSVIFLPSCNMRCPYCYNPTMVLNSDRLPTVPFEEIKNYLKQNNGWIDGVVITGGEPTVHETLPALCHKIKELGFLVKLDTNGTNPSMVEELLDKELVDYIAMDIKAPLKEEKYPKASGINAEKVLEKIKKTIDILLRSKIEYEFRTTVIPKLHNEEDIEDICRKIRGCKKYVIQNYKSNVETINPLLKEVTPFTKKRLEVFLATAKRVIPNVILRA